ncbi:hypothetical protein [Pinibacter soli]|uniref:Uncharacterized protein n=1 Tax=Pinibacter soli TaxID=3044211 RepID=A0ABT6RFL0_9BACT|nr:hypothetical protein [Pinibacter soli]MDI3321356.1 hypothetical protein [Pinibacter soli]
MKYFIVRKGVEFVIYKVSDELEQAFRQKYDKEILIEENALTDALIRFEQEFMFSIDFNTENSFPSEKDTGSAGAQPASDKMEGGDSDPPGKAR